MIDAKEWLKTPKAERQAHLVLEEPCLERGGNSTNHRGVLAEYLNTNIPAGRVILGHACNNPNCSNPRHLYWATDKENIIEDNPCWESPWDRAVKKHGLTRAKELNKRNGNPAKAGAGNKGKPKSEEHKRKIAAGVRKSNMPP